MTKRTETKLDAMRHSAAHLLAAAVQALYPEAKLGIGPAIENGFYYDFDLKDSLTPQDLARIEKKMREIGKQDLSFDRFEVPIDQAKANLAKMKQPYKVELVDELAAAGEKKVSFYHTGSFQDLCEGPHIDKTSEIGPFKLLSVSTAYWRGDQSKPQLQRIYGTAWETKEELDKYLKQLEEAKQRDHRKLGVELDLFHFEEYSPAMPYWHPKGMIVYRQLEQLAREVEVEDYQEIKTPELVSPELYKKSGHYDHYLDDMFKVLDGDKEYFLKPMNCPEALLVFKSRKRSYRELPLRLANFDVLHRTERSGVFSGLTRVREFSQDDAHILCTPDQAAEEFRKLLEAVKKVHAIFGFKSKFYLSTRPEKFMGEKSQWDQAEAALKQALAEAGLGYEVQEGEGAFYGPKIDVAAEDALGRQWQLSTLQYDLQQPAALGAKYTDMEGTDQTPIMIHRAILGSIERFLGIVLEHYGGNLPLWLAPVQVLVLTITDGQNHYAKVVFEKLIDAGIRAEVDLRSEKMGAKIRDAQLRKIPYMLIVGEREMQVQQVAVRLRDGTDLKSHSLEDILARLNKEIDNRG